MPNEFIALNQAFVAPPIIDPNQSRNGDCVLTAMVGLLSLLAVIKKGIIRDTSSLLFKEK